MPKRKSISEAAAGKLISAIQKKWGSELGDPVADESEYVMGLSHGLLQARTAKVMKGILDGKSIREYLGVDWVDNHASVLGSIEQLELAIANEIA
ncbi:hypothetical protein [Ketobacter alkanivorans]|uniref:Uncharacterized protein n=1 Tax=Ketobacter alkanivorans TaxID=1917421 RepID=A0A2K9LL01_9GAMM|nr:hypothetical protein [Ketobacter alkanivorans]AUM13036.1 hypothetical protein Kalk_11645 [Ketobacter alkanivorans]